MSLTKFFGALAIVFATSLFLPGVLHGDEPVKVSLCQLVADPQAYNHQLIEVTGFVSHGFEDFGLFDPDCGSWHDVWLEYGGTRKAGTTYCCQVRSGRSRPEELKVEDIAIPLVDDDQFREFDQLIQARNDPVVRATIVGRYFAGRAAGKSPRGMSRPGYGHMGCCSLLAIQQVMDVAPHDRNDLDYGFAADQPQMPKKNGCWHRYLTPLQTFAESLRAQKAAESENGFGFGMPEKVALDGLAGLLQVDAGSIQGMNATRLAPGRVVYEWKSADGNKSYMVVVNRPHWLSFYSSDPKKVAWVIMAAYESSCDPP